MTNLIGINVLLKYVGSIDTAHANMDEVLKKCSEIVESNFSILNRNEYTNNHWDYDSDDHTYWLDGLNQIYIGSGKENGGTGWLYEASVNYTDAVSNKTYNLISSESYDGKQEVCRITEDERIGLLDAITAHADLIPAKEALMKTASEIGETMNRETIEMFINYAAQSGIDLSKDDFVQLISENVNIYPLLGNELKCDSDIITVVIDKMIDIASDQYYDLKDEYDFSPTGGPEYMPEDVAEQYFIILPDLAADIGLDDVLSENELYKLSYTCLQKSGYDAAKKFVKTYRNDLGFVASNDIRIKEFTEAKVFSKKCCDESAALDKQVEPLKEKLRFLGYDKDVLEEALEEAMQVKFNWFERNFTKRRVYQDNLRKIADLSNQMDEKQAEFIQMQSEIKRTKDLSEQALEKGYDAHRLLVYDANEYGVKTIDDLNDCFDARKKYLADRKEVYEHCVMLAGITAAAA